MRILLVGDMVLHGAFGVSGQTKAPPEALLPLGEPLEDYDWLVGNLETPLARSTSAFGLQSTHIRARPADVATLRTLGVHAVSIVSNQTFHFGEGGFLEDVSVLESVGIRAYGDDGVSTVLEPGRESVDYMVLLLQFESTGSRSEPATCAPQRALGRGTDCGREGIPRNWP